MLASLITVLVASLTGFASPQDTSRVCPSRIYFRFDETKYDETYLDNAKAAEDIVDFLNEFDPETVQRVEVYAYSSPEGVYEHNMKLSRLRARNFNLYARAHLNGVLEGKIEVIAGGEAWGPLRERILADKKLSEANRKKILSILDDPSISNDTRKWRLQNRLTESLYKYLMRSHFRYLRCYELRIWLNEEAVADAEAEAAAQAAKLAEEQALKAAAEAAEKAAREEAEKAAREAAEKAAREAAEKAAAEEAEKAAREAAEKAEKEAAEKAAKAAEAEAEMKQAETETEVVPEEPEQLIENQETENAPDTEVEAGTEAEKADETETVYVPLLGLSSNVIYDLAATPNLALEFPLGKRFSIFVDYTNPWWVWSDNSHAWQMNKLDLGARYWLGSFDNDDPMDILHGWFVGAYVSAAYYDVEPNHKGYQGEFQSASLEGGYAWKLSPHWRVRAHGAVGFMRTHYRHYIGNEDDSRLVYQYHGRYTWFGPTELGVSVQYVFSWPKTRRTAR